MARVELGATTTRLARKPAPELPSCPEVEKPVLALPQVMTSAGSDFAVSTMRQLVPVLIPTTLPPTLTCEVD